MKSMKEKIKEILKEILSVDKYYKMNDIELEAEASKWNIREYGYTSGLINRQIIIDALIKKRKANHSGLAIFISVIALVISVLALFA